MLRGLHGRITRVVSTLFASAAVRAGGFQVIVMSAALVVPIWTTVMAPFGSPVLVGSATLVFHAVVFAAIVAATWPVPLPETHRVLATSLANKAARR